MMKKVMLLALCSLAPFAVAMAGDSPSKQSPIIESTETNFQLPQCMLTYTCPEQVKKISSMDVALHPYVKFKPVDVALHPYVKFKPVEVAGHPCVKFKPIEVAGHPCVKFKSVDQSISHDVGFA